MPSTDPTLADAPRPSRPTERFAWFAGGAVAAGLLGSLFSTAFAAQGSEAQNAVRPIPMTASGVTGDSNNRMIAVTGNDITGQSVLYLVDTVDKQIAVYQASGGAPGTQSIKMVGARNISLDLQLDGFNDKTSVGSEPLKYKDLAERFGENVDSDVDEAR